jgi:T-complex protein 1 subunit delta
MITAQSCVATSAFFLYGVAFSLVNMMIQDVVAGDGTTSVTVICGALLSKSLGLLEKGVHPTLVSEAFQLACDKAVEVLKGMSQHVDLKNKEALIDAAMTCAPAPPLSRSAISCR